MHHQWAVLPEALSDSFTRCSHCGQTMILCSRDRLTVAPWLAVATSTAVLLSLGTRDVLWRFAPSACAKYYVSWHAWYPADALRQVTYYGHSGAARAALLIKSCCKCMCVVGSDVCISRIDQT